MFDTLCQMLGCLLVLHEFISLALFRPAGTSCLSQSWLRCSTVCLPRTYGRCGPWEVVGFRAFHTSRGSQLHSATVSHLQAPTKLSFGTLCVEIERNLVIQPSCKAASDGHKVGEHVIHADAHHRIESTKASFLRNCRLHAAGC